VDRAPVVPLSEPIYDIPFTAMGAGFDAVFVSPSVRLYMIFTGDTAANAARQIVDVQSADNRRHGILRLAQESWARKGMAENDLWADMAKRDKDYTVRVAGIRALNWSRDDRYTQIFIDALKDDQPLVRMEAAKALANLPNNQASSALMDRLQNDDSRDVRVASADALRCYKTDETAHALVAVLNDSDFEVAWQARQSLRLMTAYDFGYDQRAWLDFLSGSKQPFQ
jgi:xanthine/CO dehydrogenase XdhC/CoxF family maturation factor